MTLHHVKRLYTFTVVALTTATLITGNPYLAFAAILALVNYPEWRK